MRHYNTVSEAYMGTLQDVFFNPEHVSSPRGQTVRERFEYQFRIHQPKVEFVRTYDEERNKTIETYSQKEFDLYDSGTNQVQDFARASKFWETLANPDGTVNSAYGYLIWKNKSLGNSKFEVNNDHPMRTPWQWAKQALIADKDTRQAILRFSLPEHQWVGNKDQTCTLHGVFSIRENKLNLCINMRSNDLTLGLVYDLPWFISLMYKMKDELKDVYKDLEIGYYSHYVHNIHVYDRDEDKILKMLGVKSETLRKIKERSETVGPV